MLSLIKIRVKYILRKPCLLFWTYLFLPIIILIAAIVVISKKDEKTLKSFNPFIFNKRRKFFDDNGQEYADIKDGLSGTTFLVDNENYCNTIINLLNQYGIYEDECPLCTGRESNINNHTINIIKLEKKNGKYKVELTSRIPNYEYFYLYDKMFYKKQDLSQNIIIDPYYTIEEQDWINDYDYNSECNRL